MITHTCSITVRYAETDQMKFAHHANYIIWFEHARIELMKYIGVSYAELERQGYLMPVLDVYAKYRQYAVFDETLEIVTTLPEKPRARVRFEYDVKNGDGICICTGYSSHTFINTQNKAIRPPGFLMQKVAAFF